MGGTNKDWRRTELDKPTGEIDLDAVARGPRRAPTIDDIEKLIVRGHYRHALHLSDELGRTIRPSDKIMLSYHAQRAIIFAKLGNIDEAEDNWRKAGDQPEVVEVIYFTALIELFIRRHRYADAQDLLNLLIQIPSSDKYWVWMKRSEIAVSTCKGAWDTHEQRHRNLEPAREALNAARNVRVMLSGDEAHVAELWQGLLIELHERGGTKSRETELYVQRLQDLSSAFGLRARLLRFKHRLVG